MATTPARPSVYRPIGAALDLMYDKAPEIIVSGPAGTGKTRTITYRVAYLVELGVKPESILLLTFHPARITRCRCAHRDLPARVAAPSSCATSRPVSPRLGCASIRCLALATRLANSGPPPATARSAAGTCSTGTT